MWPERIKASGDCAALLAKANPKTAFARLSLFLSAINSSLILGPIITVF
jgi:hypothetical protein